MIEPKHTNQTNLHNQPRKKVHNKLKCQAGLFDWTDKKIKRYSIMLEQIVWVLLAIVFIIVIYVLYRYFYKKNTTLTSSIYLNDQNTTIISNDKITNPTSSNFSFGLWIYVNTWNTNNKKYVFVAGNNQLTLYFDKTQPTLYTDINTATTCSATQTTETVQITNNFPQQKWVYVIVSLNGNYVDCYLDGKLITSYLTKNSTPTLSCTSNWNITMGSGFDCYVYNFVRLDYAMTPQIANDNYYSTGPKTKSQGLLSNYGAEISILKDGNVEKTLNIF
jgi:hypothetical protein